MSRSRRWAPPISVDHFDPGLDYTSLCASSGFEPWEPDFESNQKPDLTSVCSFSSFSTHKIYINMDIY